jgi:serine protease AprX
MLKRLVLSATFIATLLLAGAAIAQQPGLARLAAAPANALGSHDGVATFRGVMPTQAQVDGLRAKGLQVQRFSHLPLALLRGPRGAMVDAVKAGLAADVYPNDRLHFHSAASNLAIKANEVHALSVNGAGIGVAVIDSGIDATHPDLAKRVTHNLKIVESGQPGLDLVLAMEQTPYSNSDTSSGHGTHVAGIVAADNTTGQMIGVAPGAHLVGYGTGEAIFVFGVLTAFNDMIANKDAWKIRVVNNSWGSSFRMFDPQEPINQATRVAHGNGIVVVFAAGNSSTEMSINPYSVAPWVISTGNGTLNHQRSPTSSGGLEFDNATFIEQLPAPTGDVRHLFFSGDRIGLYHPSLSAPGTNILSTATTGVAVTSLPGGYASASGTSMAAPHIAGVVALMLQKRPSLTPDEVKSVLQVTSDLMPDTTNSSWVQPFFQVGYGYVNARAAVDLVGRNRYNKEKALARLQLSADQRVLADRDERVLSTSYWAYAAPAATIAGVPDSRAFKVSVTSATQAVKALVSYPSLGYVGQNPFNYSLTLVDAVGKTIATSTAAPNAGMSRFFVDLTDPALGPVAFGEWTLNVVGEQGAQDQDVLMGILVSVAFHQLAHQTRVSPKLPVFTATGSTTFYLTPGPAGLLTSPEGCNLQAGAPVGGLASTRPTGTCQSANMGYAVNYGANVPASFTSAPLSLPRRSPRLSPSAGLSRCASTWSIPRSPRGSRRRTRGWFSRSTQWMRTATCCSR